MAEILSRPGASDSVQKAILGQYEGDPVATLLRSLMVESQSAREGNVDYSGTQLLMQKYLGNSPTGGM